MRILHVITQLDKMYGAQRHVVESIRDHLARHHECLVVSGEIGIASAEIEAMNIQVHHLPTLKNTYNIFKDIAASKSLKQIILNYQPDIVISHSSKAGIIARIVCDSNKIPNIFTVHGWSFEKGTPWYQQLFGRLSEWCLKPFSDSYFCVSNHTASYGKQVLGLNDKQVFVCPNMHKPSNNNGYQTTLFNNVLMVACFRKQKDHHTAIKALKYIIDQKSLPNIQFTFAGDGPQRQYIEQLIEQYKLAPYINLLGEVSDIDNCYNHCDIVILPTFYEGLPIALIEAIQKHKPIIATKVGGITEIIDEGKNGNTIAVGDEIALAKFITSYYLQNSIATFGQNSGHLYQERYSYKKISAKMNEVIEQALANSMFRN
ncbi:MAG: glycosyltransferase family 4 protein [Flavobacterium sp.]|nr:glycosyltransferase family 4 protein [Flavobacterium sp.]